MTPTLLGRWQTRILLFGTIGLLITAIFAFCIVSPGGTVFWQVLGYVLLFGLLWDILYTLLQKLRWDHDWPAIFQLLAGIWEAVFVVMLVSAGILPGIESINFGWFLVHYTAVWLGIFITSQSLMRIWFPRWRFYGGRWL
ncbi:hypothetical protein [Halomicronema hongdechloris]|nr:hypothetical protein [Halomicronema hongdechloris]